MDDLRLQAVAARVAAWHNRHPLARRISAQQIRSVGYVALSVGAEAAETVLLPQAPTEALHAEPAGTRPAADHHAPSEAAEFPEEDFTAAFAALAEHHAADARAVSDASTQADGTSPPAADEPEPERDPEPESGSVEDEGFEIELDVADDAPVDADAGATVPDRAPDPMPVSAVADADADADAEAEAETGDVATLLEPPPLTTPAAQAEAVSALPQHIPTLRDRVLIRAQQPAVQGALLAAHDGYRPTPRPPVHAGTGDGAGAGAGAGAGPGADHGEGDRFMAPLSPREVARWVARHGRALLQPPSDGPIRHVRTAAVTGGPTSGTTYVLTAAIAGGGLSSRVLVGAGSPGAVLGTRLWSLPRVAAAAALAAALLAALAVTLAASLRRADHAAGASAAAHGDASVAAASAASVATSAAASAAASASAASASAPSHEGDAATPANAAAAADAASQAHVEAAPAAAPAAPELVITTVRPAPAYAQKGAVGLPPRGFALSEDDKAAAREALAAARAGLPNRPAAPGEAAASQQPPASLDPSALAERSAERSATASATPAALPPAAAPAVPTFAISTRSLRTRAEAEQLQVAITALLRTPGSATRRVELLPEGEDWRVVAWPFGGQAEADRFRGLLAGRGMKVEVVRF